MGVGDHQAHAVQVAVFEAAEELGPERLVLRVPNVDAEDFSMPVGAQAGGDDHGFGDDLAAVADMHIGGVEPDVHERLVTQIPGAEHSDVGVDVFADPRHRRARHARVAAQGHDQVVDLPRRGHDHRPQGFVDPPAGFEQLREERPGAELGDLDLEIPRRGRHHLGAVPVALRGAGQGAFMGLGADPSRHLGLDQLLDGISQDLRQRRPQGRVGVGETRAELGQGRLIVGHRAIPLSWLALLRIARWPPHPEGPGAVRPTYTTRWDSPSS